MLTDHPADLVEQLVKTGRYENTSEVPEEGLSLFEKQEAEDIYFLSPNGSGVTWIDCHFSLENGEIWVGSFSQKVAQTLQEQILSAGLPSYE